MSGLQRDYLAPALLSHVTSTLHDCFSDPGKLTLDQAERAHRLRAQCSPICRLRARVDEFRSGRSELDNGGA